MTDLAPASLQAETAPAPDFINRLSSSLARVIDHEGWVFSFKSADQTFVISSEEMSAPDGFLPIVLHRASHWMTQSMGDRALMGFRIDAGGIARVVPETMGPTASVAVWTTFAHYALDEWVRRHPEWAKRQEPVAIDALVEAFDRDLATQAIPVLPARMGSFPDMSAGVRT